MTAILAGLSLAFGIGYFIDSSNASIVAKVLELTSLAVFLFLLIPAMWINSKLSVWPCPRCGKSFYGPFATRFLRSRMQCRNCGLPKWADPTTGMIG
jgi:hypothetical protein